MKRRRKRRSQSPSRKLSACLRPHTAALGTRRARPTRTLDRAPRTRTLEHTQNAGQSAAYQNAGSYQNAGFLQNAGYAQSLALQQSMMNAHAQSMAQRAGFGALPQHLQVRCGVALCFSCLDNQGIMEVSAGDLHL